MQLLRAVKGIPKPLQKLIIYETDQLIDSLFLESAQTGLVFPFYKLVPDFTDSQNSMINFREVTLKAGKIPSLLLSIEKALLFASSVSTYWLREGMVKGYIVCESKGKKESAPGEIINWLLIRIEKFQNFFKFSNVMFNNTYDEISRLSASEGIGKFEDVLVPVSAGMGEALRLIRSLEDVHKVALCVNEAVKHNATALKNKNMGDFNLTFSLYESLRLPNPKKIRLWHKTNNIFIK